MPGGVMPHRYLVPGFPADDLGHRSVGMLQDTFKVVDGVPVPEPVGQFPGLQQEVRIVRAAESGLVPGEGLVDKDPSRADAFAQTGDEWPMEVAEDQDPPVVLLLQRVAVRFEVYLPELRQDPPVFGRSPGRLQRLHGAIGQHHGQLQTGQEEPVLASARSQIQNRTLQVLVLEERAEFHRERIGGHRLPAGLVGSGHCHHNGGGSTYHKAEGE